MHNFQQTYDKIERAEFVGFRTFKNGIISEDVGVQEDIFSFYEINNFHPIDKYDQCPWLVLANEQGYLVIDSSNHILDRVDLSLSYKDKLKLEIARDSMLVSQTN